MSPDTYPLKWITDSVCVGYAPRSEEHLQQISAAGVGSIVNLCAECYDLHEIEAAADFSVYHLPVADEYAPGLDELKTVLAWMDAEIAGGRKILVHCRYGIGRTGTVVMAYLIHLGYSVDQSEALLSESPSRPTSYEQLRLLEIFYKEAGDGSRIKLTDREEKGSYFDKIKTMLGWT